MKLPGKADAVCVKEDCGTCQKGDSCSRESLAEWQLICPVPLGRERWPASGYSELLALFGSSCSENLDTCDRRGQCTFLSVEAVTHSLDQWDPQTQASAGSSTRSECDTAWSSAHCELRGTVCVCSRDSMPLRPGYDVVVHRSHFWGYLHGLMAQP